MPKKERNTKKERKLKERAVVEYYDSKGEMKQILCRIYRETLKEIDRSPRAEWPVWSQYQSLMWKKIDSSSLNEEEKIKGEEALCNRFPLERIEEL